MQGRCADESKEIARREAIRQAASRRRWTSEQKDMLSCSHRGNRTSTETRLKQSESAKRAWNSSPERKEAYNTAFSGENNPRFNCDREAVLRNRKLGLAYRGLIRRLILCGRTEKTDHTEKMLGYSKDELLLCIEGKFESGMSWKNYGMGKGKWCIDHVRPIVSFPASASPAEINSLDNLQPMWWYDNLSKGSKLIGE
jgi:hypothetical protein